MSTKNELTKEKIAESISKLIGEDNEKLAVIWNRLEKTPLYMIKSFKGKGGFRGSAVTSQLQRRNMVKLFGDIGHGWGLDNVEIKFEVLGGDARNTLCVGMADFWYVHPEDGERKVYKVGADMWVFYSYFADGKTQWRRDNDVVKKVMTDMTTKGMSFIGANADVFYGLFDDNKYVERMRKEYGGDFITDDPYPEKKEPVGGEDKKKQRPNLSLKSNKSMKSVLGHILDGRDYRWIIARIVQVGYDIPDEVKSEIEELMKKKREELEVMLRELDEGEGK